MSEITRWNPFREMTDMQRAMDRVFQDTWRPFFEGGSLNLNALALDVHENDQEYTITTEVPGVKPENIHVKLDGDMLIIEGEIPEETVQKEGTRTLIKERRYGHFSRRVRLPQSVNTTNVEASYENGLLTLTLPKAPEVQPKMIPVKTGNGSK